MPVLRRASLCLPVFLVLLASQAVAQKTFEVISIRENLSPGGPQSYGATPDGYHMVNLPLGVVFLAAYVQTNTNSMFNPENIIGIKDPVLSSTRYDIDARVSEADRAAWNDPRQQPEMMREMLQAMLSDRFHLRVHREMKQQDIYLLQVAKGGPKFQETKPDEPHPGAFALPGGGFASPGSDNTFHLFDVPISSLSSFILSTAAGRTVQDDTGLSGHYDLSFPKPAFANSGPTTDASSDTSPSIFTVLAGLGLKLEPAKREVETLVIDHVEKPTAN
ncbi:MAG TPA: TIGR03435 family protein [Acidobacteriaceae bacterium]|nr:TIGR03435 family protein [Acidobacteriaceae bacterium]